MNDRSCIFCVMYIFFLIPKLIKIQFYFYNIYIDIMMHLFVACLFLCVEICVIKRGQRRSNKQIFVPLL